MKAFVRHFVQMLCSVLDTTCGSVVFYVLGFTMTHSHAVVVELL